ncbi:phenylalanine--tRNA ligase subunit beta [Dermabacter vaginalis]|uniref:Phenylalanine--tRNA ligase beta subunit n=1 Tax=Dermabacter vaginalis TaxID=1630135 RepID=A0ABX6A2Z4_9MICO|nr:phenylalanine--tRNA ligase subunit beta [Dermabacter vaginalis]QEU11478.1 phenylalanine--tRNA ligase subunit beta [Dermabacter vaginalis]
MPRIPLSWLGEHVELADGANAEAVAASLVSVGLEEEGIFGAQVTGPLVVGRVLNLVKETHKNGKTVNWCRVDVGPEHNDDKDNPKDPQPGDEVPSRGIICGAHNFVEGDLVVVSLPGTVLPGNFEIAARKTYGHLSDGMICSTEELGLGEDTEDGIIVLGKGIAEGIEAKPGDDAIALFGLDEEVVEINVTPDRGYCFSMRGVAREYSHATGRAFTDPALAIEVPEAAGEGFEVLLEDDAPIRGNVGATSYVAQCVRGVDTSAPSPRWMQQRLTLAGMRPISLIVDVGNYVMLDLGQPLHMFDAAKLTAPIVVRRAKEGEKLTTLDDKTRKLHVEDLVVADSTGGHGARAVALAGVMGGSETEVDENTADVVIEAAHFDPTTQARTARRHKLVSEAGKRGERGVDPELVEVAAYRAAQLLVEYGGGTLDSARTHARAGESAPVEIALPLDYAERVVGIDYTRDQVVGSLEKIGCTVTAGKDDGEGETLAVLPPTWRGDLRIPEDLVEEIARLEGYDAIPSRLPSAPGGRGLTRAQRSRRALANALAEAGATEVVSFPFTNEKTFSKLRLPEDSPLREAVRLLNPLADDEPLMRTAVLETLLPVAQRNLARGEDAVAVFELGLVFEKRGERVPVPSAASRPSDAELEEIATSLAKQDRHVALVAGGPITPTGPLTEARAWDWADAISFARRVAAAAGTELVLEQGESSAFHPGRTAILSTAEGERVGVAGELHPAVIKAFGLPKHAAAFELNLEAVIDSAPDVVPSEPISTFPIAKEDFAFVVDEGTPAEAVRAALIVGIGDVAEEVRLFDEYRGDQVAEGKKSLAFAVRLRPQDKTLKGTEIDEIRARAIKAVASAVGGELRA